MSSKSNSINVTGNQNQVFQAIKNSTINNNFHQNQWDALQPNIDLAKLREELKLLRENLVKKEKTDESNSCIEALESAENELKKKNDPKALEFLKKACKWALDTASEIGTTVAAEVIKSAMGLNP